MRCNGGHSGFMVLDVDIGFGAFKHSPLLSTSGSGLGRVLILGPSAARRLDTHAVWLVEASLRTFLQSICFHAYSHRSECCMGWHHKSCKPNTAFVDGRRGFSQCVMDIFSTSIPGVFRGLSGLSGF